MQVRRVSDLGLSEFSARLESTGVGITLGPLNANLEVLVPVIAPVLYDLYRDFPLLPPGSLYSFHANITQRRSRWRPWNNLVRFKVDGRVPHEDMPIDQALPVLEWGINLIIALRCHSFLMLHSAVLEKNGHALLLPAAPGSGKSTLCAALCHSGWRLLSDEFGLVRPGGDEFEALPRPIALKNESIDVIKSYLPSATFGPTIRNTRKGDVAHVKPPQDSVLRQGEKAPAKWVVHPRWRAGSTLTVQHVPRAEAFMMLAMNAFNYELLGEQGFRTASSLVAQCACSQLVYSELDDALAYFEDLAASDG